MTTSSISSRSWLRLVAPLVFWLVLWQLSAASVGQELLIPTPWAVAVRLGELAATAPFWLTAGMSLVRIMAGMLAGVLLGCVLAVCTWAFPWADFVLSPAIRVIRAVPVASFILLVLLWTPRTTVPAVTAGLMVLPVVWGNVVRGLAETDPKLIELAHALRFSRRKRGLLIYLPCTLPYFLSACTTSLGLAWKAGVAAEVICTPVLAIGTELGRTKLYLETPSLFAWTIVVVVLSIALECGLNALVGRLRRRWLHAQPA